MSDPRVEPLHPIALGVYAPPPAHAMRREPAEGFFATGFHGTSWARIRNPGSRFPCPSDHASFLLQEGF